jgi:hypothetical protein
MRQQTKPFIIERKPSRKPNAQKPSIWGRLDADIAQGLKDKRNMEQAAATGGDDRFAWDCDQYLVPVFGNVDAYQNTGIRSMLNLGHSRSPLWCGSQNHYRDLRPGYGRLLRNF